MDLSLFKDFKKQYYYRGLKNLTVLNCSEDIAEFSNKDTITTKNTETFLNGQLISNIGDLSINELTMLYLNILKTKGYKFI